LRVWGQNDLQNVKIEQSIYWEGDYLRHTSFFEPWCVEVFLPVWPLHGRAQTKCMTEGRKLQEVFVSRMRMQPLAGGI